MDASLLALAKSIYFCYVSLFLQRRFARKCGQNHSPRMLKSTDFRLTYVAQKRVCFKLHFVIREFNTAQDENSLSLSTFKYKGILKFCFLSAKITLVCRVDNQFPWYKWFYFHAIQSALFRSPSLFLNIWSFASWVNKKADPPCERRICSLESLRESVDATKVCTNGCT